MIAIFNLEYKSDLEGCHLGILAAESVLEIPP